jgi:hypothetical protein
MVDAAERCVSLMTSNGNDLPAPDEEGEPEFITGSCQMEQDNIVAIVFDSWPIRWPLLSKCLKEQSFGYPTVIIMVEHHIC